jgi:hypothetical protein
MDDKLNVINTALIEVMNRYRNFFLGPGVNLDPENVPFREREDFYAPLVTALGHTYGLRALENNNNYIIEVSVNVYGDEFNFSKYKAKLTEEFSEENARKVMKNFLSEKDEIWLKGTDPYSLSKYFHKVSPDDAEITTKPKKSQSKVTGMMIDHILVQRFKLNNDYLNELIANPNILSAAIYLYCLRLFVSAYRKSLNPPRKKK